MTWRKEGLLAAGVLLLAIGSLAPARAEETSRYIVERDIPMFSFEDPVKLRVKVLDNTRREIRDAKVIFEILPAMGPPPFSHQKEMHLKTTISHGESSDPEGKQYLHHLSTMKLADEVKSIQKIAAYDASTGYYTAMHTFPRFAWGIRVYVAGRDGHLQRVGPVLPHRSHCEFFDVTNIELAKTYLRQVGALARKGQWPDVDGRLRFIDASMNGKHGLYYMTKRHHGYNTSEVEREMSQLQTVAARKSSDSVLQSVRSVLAAVQRAEDSFGAISVKKTGEEAYEYEIVVRDNANEKGVTGALVVVQENYDPEEDLTNPAIVAFQPPAEGMYHAKVAHLPEGILAAEVGDGRYRFKSEDFGNGKKQKRIFVYYALDRPGIQSKFVTRVINMP